MSLPRSHRRLVKSLRALASASPLLPAISESFKSKLVDFSRTASRFPGAEYSSADFTTAIQFSSALADAPKPILSQFLRKGDSFISVSGSNSLASDSPIPPAKQTISYFLGSQFLGNKFPLHRKFHSNNTGYRNISSSAASSSSAANPANGAASAPNDPGSMTVHESARLRFKDPNEKAPLDERTQLIRTFRQMVYYAQFLPNAEEIRKTIRESYRKGEGDLAKAISTLSFIKFQVPASQRKDKRDQVGVTRYIFDNWGDIVKVNDAGQIPGAPPFNVYNHQGITDEQIRRHYGLLERMNYEGETWKGKKTPYIIECQKKMATMRDKIQFE